MRMKFYNNEKLLYTAIQLEIFCLIIFIFLSGYTLRMGHIEHEKLIESTQLRYESYLLADQLRQSSDDLTRMVRTYVETGDSKFEDYFWDIKAIRDGIKPRPVNYERIYWDFMTVKQPVPPFKEGETVSLEKLMKEAGFTEKEIHLLDNAKNRADKLIALERIAIHAMKGKFIDVNGDFTISGEADPEMARQIVFGEEYHEAKKGIMEPINEFLKTIDQRTFQNVSFTNSQVQFHQIASDSIFIALILNGLLLLLTIKRHQYLLIGKLETFIDKKEKETSQQEELGVANENLEKQTQLLKQSEKELKQPPSEELKVSYEWLTEKQETLAKQYDELEWAKWGLEVKADELKQVSKYKSEFLANMSHEFRTPLNSMLLLSKSLAENKKNNLTKEQIEDAEVINRGGKDLLNLINDIMDLSKVEAGMLSVTTEDVKINTIVSTLHRYFDPIAKSRNLTFKIARNKNTPESIKTDGKRLEQILKNFLSNAMKFTENGSVSLKIMLPDHGRKYKQSHLSCDTAIAFAVIDTGIGIPDDKQDAIFEAFQQQDGSINREYGGTGLGLSISRELASLLEGEIQLESSYGHGSTFTLYLPKEYKETDEDQIKIELSDSSPDEGETNQNTQEPVEISLPDISNPSLVEDDRNDIVKGDRTSQMIPEHIFKNQKILLVDDDMRNTYALSRRLIEVGLNVEMAKNGREAVDILEKDNSYELVIIDMMMPVMDGYTAIEYIRNMQEYKMIPIFALTAKAMPEDRNKCLEAGASEYMTKPVDFGKLLSILQIWLFKQL